MRLAPFDDDSGGRILIVERVRMCALEGDSVHANFNKPGCQAFFLMKICHNSPQKVKFAGSTTIRIITDGETWAPVIAMNASFELEDGFKVLNIRREEDLSQWDTRGYRFGQADQRLIRMILGYQVCDDHPYYWSIEWDKDSCKVTGIGPIPCLEFRLPRVTPSPAHC